MGYGRVAGRLRRPAMNAATGAFAADAPTVAAEVPQVAKSPAVTSERLLNADKEVGNWITHHGDYLGHRFSPLTEINKDTVKN